MRIQISSRLGANNEAVQTHVLSRLSEVATTEGLAVDEASSRLLYIVIKSDAAGTGFEVRLAYTPAGVHALQPEPIFECPGCDAPMLLDAIAEKSRPLLRELKKPKPVAKPKEPEPAPEPVFVPQGPPRGLGLWGSGIILTSLGASMALGAGIGLAVTTTDKGFEKNATAGWAFLGAGSALLASGIPLLIIGQKRMREPRRPRASVAYNGRMVNVGLRGSF